MQTIVTERILYKKEPRLALRFAYDAALVKQVKQVDDAQWSQPLRLWHIPLSEQAYNQLKLLTQELAILKKGENRIPHGVILTPVTPEVAEALTAFTRYMEQRRYSPRTIQTYEHSLKQFLQWVAKPTNQITNNDLEQFNHDFILSNS